MRRNKYLRHGFLSILALAMSLSATAARADVVRSDITDIGQSLKLPVYKWSDESASAKGVIFAIHGATLYARRFQTAAEHFAQQGYPVYALDLRGFGSWRTNGTEYADGDELIHYQMSENDIVQVLTKLREANPDAKIYCLGESLGANLAVWVGSEHPALADGLVLVSPCVKNCVHIGPRLVVDLVLGFLNPNRNMSLSPYIKPYLCDDRLATAEYIDDPEIRHVLSPVELVKSFKTNTLAIAEMDKMPADLPVLVVAGKRDKIYSSRAIPRFVNGMGSKRKTVEIIPNHGHLLIESPRVRPGVLSIIDGWLSESDRTARAPLSKSAAETTADADISKLGSTR
jgi:alpha-beta hydrolase superfamily lysophospholipase